jgi:hypothetical protein
LYLTPMPCLLIAWDQVNSTSAAMGHTKAVDTAQVHSAEPLSVAPPEMSTTELSKQEGALVEQTAASTCVSDLVTPGPDISLATNSAPMAETERNVKC